MRPEIVGLLHVPRERGAAASIGALRARGRINHATARPPTRLFSAIAASASAQLPTRNAWLLPAASTPPSSSHRSLRRLSTASEAASASPTESGRRKRNPKKREPYAPHLDEGLSEEQRSVLDLVLNQRQNVFFTGPAGTGKSLLLKRIIEGLTTKYRKKKHSHSRVAVTASTGLAAYSIGGTTVHRFAGIGTGKAPTEMLIKHIQRDQEVKLHRWKKVKALVIDEISMIDAALFDKLDAIARALRRKGRPFGGIQLVITGDFFQLPPVLQGRDDLSIPRFCFEAAAWKTAIQHTIGLTQIFRQRDPVFAAMLNEIRGGRLSPATVDTFKSLNRPPTCLAENGPETAELFPLRREADAANRRRMQEIKTEARTYGARDGGIITDPAARKRLLSDCMAPEMLEMKEGAQVMLIKNVDETLVNGSLGRVVGFAHKLNDQQPLVSLSRYPVVRFQLAHGGTRTQLCEPAKWSVERWVRDEWSDDGWTVETLATRTQVPLILAWALSIHKSQGQTLELVKVDLNRVFEAGQAYVALSRAKTVEGLQVLNFDERKVGAHPKVVGFYRGLEAAGGGVVV